MLTKNDLSQIEGIVEKVVDRKLDQKLDQKLKPINKKLDKIQKDLNATTRVFDNDIANLRQRVRRIENHLELNLPL